MPGSVASAVGSAVASKAIGSIMGGGKKSGAGVIGPQFAIPQYNAGGYGLTYHMPGGSVAKSRPEMAGSPYLTVSPQRQAALDAIVNSYRIQAAGLRDSTKEVGGIYAPAIEGLTENIARVRPGFGELTKARVQSVQNAGQAARSDLRGNLATRRILGSSFADDALSRQALETGQQEAEVRARSFLEELDLETKLIGEKLSTQMQGFQDMQNLARDAFSAERAGTQSELDEMNKQFDIITGVVNTMAGIAQRNAEISAEYAAQGAQARGGMIGNISGPVGKGFGDMIGNAFSFSRTGGQGFNLGNMFGSLTGAYGPGF